MSIRRNRGYEGRVGAGVPSVDKPEFIEDGEGRRFQKQIVDFGPGYTYIPVANESPVVSGDAPSVSGLFSRDFSAAISKHYTPVAEEAQEDITEEKIAQLELALQGHGAQGDDLARRLEAARAALAQKAVAQQAEKARVAYLAEIGVAQPLVQFSSTISNAHYTQDGFAQSTLTSGAPEKAKSPRKKQLTRKLGVWVTATGLVVGGGGAAAMSASPESFIATFIDQNQSNGDESKNVLQLPSAALIDAFGGCLDDNGAGKPLVEFTVTSKTEVNHNYTSSKNTPKILETDFTDENDNVIRESVKPVIITPDADTKVTACVIDEDKTSVLKIENDSVIVDMSKISPQLFLDGNKAVRGFPEKDTITDPAKDLWPVSAIVEGNIEAGKTAPDTVEKITPEIGKAILDNFNNPANLAAEIRQAQEKAAQVLIRPNGGHQEKIKSTLQTKIADAIKAQATSLKEQGLTDVGDPKVSFTNQMKDLVEKNPDAPKVDSFSLAATTQITNFVVKSTEVATENK